MPSRRSPRPWRTRGMRSPLFCPVIPRRWPARCRPDGIETAPEDRDGRPVPFRATCGPFRPGRTSPCTSSCREEFFERKNPYGTGEREYEDNADRFIFFCKAVVETLRLADIQADIVHCHDWQAAPDSAAPARRPSSARRHARDEDDLHDPRHRLPGTLSGRDLRAHEPAPMSSTPWTAWNSTAR